MGKGNDIQEGLGIFFVLLGGAAIILSLAYAVHILTW